MTYGDWIALIMEEFNVTEKEARAMYKTMLLTRDILRINPAAENFMNKPE